MGKNILEIYIQIQLLQHRANLKLRRRLQQKPIEVSNVESPSRKPNFY